MAGLPLSRSALDRLGERLVAHGHVAPEDEEAFAEVVDAYQQILDHVEQHLADLGFQAGTRVKTTGVLIEKLQRESCRLSQVQDLAGARILVSDRLEQDKAAARLVEHFDRCNPKPSKVIDRRDNPSHGYRAVHVIVFPQGVPVEIQVRTALQDIWAQIFESVADQWGRAIRYGDSPDDAPLVVQGRKISRKVAHQVLLGLSNEIAGLEERRLGIAEAEENVAGLAAGIAELRSLTDPDAFNRPLREVLPQEGMEGIRDMTRRLEANGAIPPEEVQDPSETTLAEVARMLEAGRHWFRGVLAAQRQDHDGMEATIRGTLQVIADAAGEVGA